jgi:hypothetical protein
VQPVKPGDVPYDHRNWRFPSERVIATVVVDAILRDVFQGKHPLAREQALDVACKATRKIDWAAPSAGALKRLGRHA